MAVLDTLINLFPGVAASLQFVRDLSVLGGAVLLTGIGLAWLKHAQLRHSVTLEARRRGLTELSAEFLASIAWREGPEAVHHLLRSTNSIRARMARELGAFRDQQVASRFAVQAARLMDELKMRKSTLEGMPLLFEKVLISGGPTDRTPSVYAFLVEVEEDDLRLVSPGLCPWEEGREMHIQRTETCAEPLVVTLKLRPIRSNREWVASLDFRASGLDSRRATRRRCHIQTWTLPTTAGAYTLRGRLQSGLPLKPETLEGLKAWPRRQAVVIEDISCDGARLVVKHDRRRGDHFYLALSTADGFLVALPLAEVVSARQNETGSFVLNTRFCAVRLRERNLLADHAQQAATSTAVTPDS
ncbi:MAG: hypothetical protein P8N09_12645 [Planctomycetota bacterium]|nr:hypothetical protein [Planctomycetota bacterium]